MTCGWCADPLEIRFVWHMDLIMAQASLSVWLAAALGLEIERLASRKMFPASRIMPADVTAFSLHCLAAPTTSTVLSYSP